MKEVLEIQLTADNKSAITGINQTAVTLDKFAASAKASSASLGAASQVAVKSTKDFTGLSRVIQDLPYGFNAISNNLTQLLPAAGAAGLAFSGIVTALTLAQIGFGAWTRGMDKLGGSTAAAAKALEEYNKELAKQMQNSASDISQLRALISVAQDASLSIEKRKIAIKELQDKYPAYFKDLNAENSLTKDLTGVTNELTSAIYKRAEARAREADIAKKATQVFENQLKIEQLNQDLAKAKQARDKAPAGQFVAGGSMTGISSAASEAAATRAALSGKVVEITKQLNEVLDQNHNLMFDIAVSQNKVNQIYGQTIELDDKQTKTTKHKLTEAEKYAKFLEHFRGMMQEQQNASLSLAAIQEPKEKEQGPTPLKAMGKFERDINTGKKGIQQIDEANEKMLKNASQWAAGAAGAFDALFASMEKGMGIGDALGNMFKQLANDIAKAAMKALVFKLILNIFSGGISAGKEGIKFLDIFKGFLGGGSKGFAEGGTVSGPSSGYPAILHGTEHILRPDQLNRIVMGSAQIGGMTGMGAQRITVDGRVSGNDIYLSQRRTEFYRNLRQ